MNVIVLLAGDSEAFREAGYSWPKNLVEIAGRPAVELVLDRLTSLRSVGARIVCLIRKDENRQYHTADVIRLLDPTACVVEVPQLTAGAACTALLAIEQIRLEEPLLITNGDQVLDCDLASIGASFEVQHLDGGIVVFQAVHPRWSYVKVDRNGHLVEAAEKRPISDLATAGTYWFRRAELFFSAAMDMIRKDAHVEGHFYVCPAYNELVLRGAQIGVYRIAREEYFSLATPQGARSYEDHLVETRT